MTDSARRAWLVPALLGAVLVCLLAASAWLWLGRRESLDPAAVEAAKQEARSFFSHDYRQAGDDVERVLGLATGEFRQRYAAKAEAVVAEVTRKRLVASAQVPTDGAAVEYFHDGRAQVLVTVDVTGRDRQGKGKAHYRARLELLEVGDRWLVSRLERLG